MLELDQVSKSFGRTRALADVSFAVGYGEIAGFVGPNGAGKTTTMRILVGLASADSGSVRWHGTRLTSPTQRRFGYMPEERGLYPKMRVDAQLRYFAELAGVGGSDVAADVDEVVSRVGLQGVVERRLEELSLGNQQRVQLAAALVGRPAMLVLDEPFSGLDPVGVDSLAQVLRDRVGAGVAVLFSSHQLELVDRLCDSVVIINRGSIVATRSHHELQANSPRGWSVTVSGRSSSGWISSVEGVSVVTCEEHSESTRWTLRLGAETDEQRVLDAARSEHRVVEFSPLRASLSDVFRDLVGAEDDLLVAEAVR